MMRLATLTKEVCFLLTEMMTITRLIKINLVSFNDNNDNDVANEGNSAFKDNEDDRDNKVCATTIGAKPSLCDFVVAKHFFRKTMIVEPQQIN